MMMRLTTTFAFFLTMVLAAPVLGITVGGDGHATYGGWTDLASKILVIGNQQVFVEPENPSQTYDLASSIFNFYASPEATDRGATPFLALFTGGSVHDFNNYDIIAVGDLVTLAAADADSPQSVAFQAAAGSVTVNQGETIVGGFFADFYSPIGFGFGAVGNTRILVVGDASVAGDINVTGNDYSGYPNVNSRIYDFDIDLSIRQANANIDLSFSRANAVPEPVTATLGLMALGVLGLATRRRLA